MADTSTFKWISDGRTCLFTHGPSASVSTSKNGYKRCRLKSRSIPQERFDTALSTHQTHHSRAISTVWQDDYVADQWDLCLAEEEHAELRMSALSELWKKLAFRSTSLVVRL